MEINERRTQLGGRIELAKNSSAGESEAESKGAAKVILRGPNEGYAPPPQSKEDIPIEPAPEELFITSDKETYLAACAKYGVVPDESVLAAFADGVQTLDLTGRKIGLSGALALLAGLEQNHGIKKVILKDNAIGSKGHGRYRFTLASKGSG